MVALSDAQRKANDMVAEQLSEVLVNIGTGMK